MFQIYVTKCIYNVTDFKMFTKRYVIQSYVLQYLRDKTK